jgi:hypothetical protein
LSLNDRPFAAGSVAGLKQIPTFAQNPISLSDENLPTLPVMSSLTRGCAMLSTWPIRV